MEYKGFLITPSPSFGPKCFSIATQGRGGKIPNCMTGAFTSRGVAMQIIDTYLSNKDQKVKTNDKESSEGGS